MNTSEKECYQVASSEVDWDMHTIITQYGKDINSLHPDLSKTHAENYFDGSAISLWWPNRDENGNQYVCKQSLLSNCFNHFNHYFRRTVAVMLLKARMGLSFLLV